MPPKRPRADWRSPLFVWRGALRYDAGTRRLAWRGAWLSAEPGAGAPADAALAASENAFEQGADGVGPLEIAGVAGGVADAGAGIGADAAAGAAAGAAVDGAAAGADASLLGRALLGAALSLRGSYLLDQGDGRGRTRFEDVSHRLAVAALPLGASGEPFAARVAACGQTEFGSFVSYGRVSVSARPGPSGPEPGPGPGGAPELVLTLARRYVDDADPRAKWEDAAEALRRCAELAGVAAPADAGAGAGAADKDAGKGAGGAGRGKDAGGGDAGGGGGGGGGAGPPEQSAAAAASAWAEIDAALPWRLDRKLQRVEPRK